MTDKVKALLLGLVEDLDKGKLTATQQRDLAETLVSLKSSFYAEEVDPAAFDVPESAADLTSGVASTSGYDCIATDVPDVLSVPVPAIGDELFGLDHKSWGRIVDQTKTAWILEGGRIAKKENEGKKWTFKHDGEMAFVVKLVLREAIVVDYDVDGYLVTYCVPVHKFALEMFGHCSCNDTDIPESETHTLTYDELVNLAKKKADIRELAITTDPQLLEIYSKILLTNNKKELLKGSKKMEN
jgi:hypothetical protein